MSRVEPWILVTFSRFFNRLNFISNVILYREKMK